MTLIADLREKVSRLVMELGEIFSKDNHDYIIKEKKQIGQLVDWIQQLTKVERSMMVRYEDEQIMVVNLIE